MEKSFVIVIPSFNNKIWCEKNLSSVLNQQYNNYSIIYTDDHSSDFTLEEVDRVINKYNTNKITLVKNDKRLGAMNNMYNMVHSCKDDDIIVVLDGDDWFYDDKVLEKLNKAYENDIWITYGQYRSYPDNSLGCSRQIPDFIIKQNSYRRFQWCSSHLRTYYAWLFKKIKKDDLMFNGEFLPMTSDLAAMFPMLEMAGKHQLFISDILYIYNCSSPINDDKVNRKLQIQLEKKIRSMNPYKAL